MKGCMAVFRRLFIPLRHKTLMMKNLIRSPSFLWIASMLCLFSSCQPKSGIPPADLYRNEYTGQLLTEMEFNKFWGSIRIDSLDSLGRKKEITLNFKMRVNQNDTVIQPFSYDIRVGREYLVSSKSKEKIGLHIAPQKFRLISGDSVHIGGSMLRPALINLWFVECTGCVQEMPMLNKLKEKYTGKVDFIAVTFQPEDKVNKFLKKTDFNFDHIASAEGFINLIGTQPYPENIFVNKDGKIEYIEGIGTTDMEYFESLLDSMI